MSKRAPSTTPPSSSPEAPVATEVVKRARATLAALPPLEPAPRPDLGLETSTPRPPGPSTPGPATHGGRVGRSRRELLRGLTGGSAPAALSAAKVGDRKPRTAVHALVDRITQGFQLEELQRAEALGYRAYLEEQLDPDSIDDSATDARLANFPTLSMSPKELTDTYAMDTEIPFMELKGATLVRAVHSKRQLFERMVEFWSDHFSIDHQKDPMWALKSEDDRDVIRRHALSSFPELLHASAKSGAMLYYLDNWLNLTGAVQENYARELLELHTLGVNGGYTERDVKEVAKVFTGWSLGLDASSPDYLRFQFRRTWHQPTRKVVLGQVISKFSYRRGGEAVLDLLAMHPSTAVHISTKMIRWLLTDTPPQSLVDEVSGTYLATGGDIKSMIRVILAPRNLRPGSKVVTPRFKRPAHLVASLLRGLDAEVYDPQYLVYYLGTMGHSPFDWSPPNGYPDSVAAWGSSLLPRWSFASHLVAGGIPGVQIPLGKVLQKLGNFEPEGLAARIDERLLGGSLSAADRGRVRAFLAGRAPIVWPDVFEAIGLAASAPGYQWY